MNMDMDAEISIEWKTLAIYLWERALHLMSHIERMSEQRPRGCDREKEGIRKR